MSIKKILNIFLILFCSDVHAEIFKCYDHSGHVYYTDKPENSPPCKYKKVEREPEEIRIERERREYIKEYREKVRNTARFLDDVEAARKRK
ncbi:DUF4124 domain-containing protein [Methylicorpusculum oleiharenae]|uniref:DUF4124 domain-containing protein n=1 Tax=Methylicorpusculum oleiharenae TaxID=1338687 RepID=UPI0013586876|nr:DUF4124 domain-containing protein [Methylicorpusculum oleiharenae]